MEKIIKKLIDYHLKGVDTYTYNGSTWLIFTETKQWVIELTNDKTLWYNYNFFNSVFSFLSLEVVENQHLITKWVEDNVMNKVEKTRMAYMKTDWSINDTIENGVKETKISPTHTEYGDWLDGDERLDNIIQNGIKETQFNWYENKSWVEGVIKGGVKQTLPEVGRYINDVEEVIQDGILNTYEDLYNRIHRMEGVIKNGIKETSHRQYLKTYNIDDTIQDGTEHDYWVMDGCNTPVDEVIDNGIRETKKLSESVVNWVSDIIDNSEKINGTYAGGQRQSEKCKSIVEYGTKNPTD